MEGRFSGARAPDSAVAKPNDSYRLLTTIPGIGPVIASTIQYETGDIARFATVGNHVTGSSSIEGLPGDDGQGMSIEATEHATIFLNSASVTGPMQLIVSDLILDEATTQSMPVEFTEDNEVAGNGGIYISGASALAGNLGIGAFAKGYFESGTSIAGNLECGAGGDAWCEDSSVISGSSNCAQCVKVP